MVAVVVRTGLWVVRKEWDREVVGDILATRVSLSVVPVRGFGDGAHFLDQLYLQRGGAGDGAAGDSMSCSWWFGGMVFMLWLVVVGLTPKTVCRKLN